MSFSYDDDDLPELPDRPVPEPLHRPAADPWFALEPPKKQVTSSDTKRVVKTVVSLGVSLVLFGAVLWGGFTLFNMFMPVIEGAQ